METILQADRQGPSRPLRLGELRGMINRLRSAQVAASVNDDPRWAALAEAIHGLQDLHKIDTGEQY